MILQIAISIVIGNATIRVKLINIKTKERDWTDLFAKINCTDFCLIYRKVFYECRVQKV